MGTAAAIVGGSIVGGLISSSASKSAANTQADAARYAGDLQAQAQHEATEEQKRQYDLGREDLAPWREAGEKALTDYANMISAGPGEFEKSPGYEFRLGEGVKAMERGAAARGGQLGGAQQKALTRYGQDYATNDYDAFLNRYYQKMNPLANLAGVGQNATNAGVQAGQNYANAMSNTTMQGAANQGNYAMQGGNARASGYINQANSWTGALNSGFNNYLAYQGTQQSPYMWGGIAQGF